MLFNSVTYLLFIPIVFACYWLARSDRQQNLILLIASLVFYGWWSVPCLGLMVATILLNYALTVCERHGKLRLVLTLILNFGILGIFKYFNFFADNLAALLSIVGMNADMPTLDIVLPVGISFYTFQLSAYAVDCYRGDIRQERSLLRFMAFISFFPQLVAGPIERGSSLLPQISRKREFNEIQATQGMRLILWGLMKKMLLADNCASQADFVFDNWDTVSMPTLWLGAIYFTFQIYGDFSGYSDIAAGSARLFGIEISRNFNRPYFSTTLKEFWRRWHITLMGWFKDYVYIPLGGSRNGAFRRLMNVLCVFLLSGLWHGSKWTFVCWGAYHWFFYSILRGRSSSSRIGRLVSVLACMFIVVVGWVIFRAPDMSAAVGFIGGMFNFSALSLPSCSRMPLMLIALLLLVEWRMHDEWHPFLWKECGWQSHQTVRMAIYLLLFVMTVVWGGEKTQFIYFQF